MTRAMRIARNFFFIWVFLLLMFGLYIYRLPPGLPRWEVRPWAWNPSHCSKAVPESAALLCGIAVDDFTIPVLPLHCLWILAVFFGIFPLGFRKISRAIFGALTIKKWISDVFTRFFGKACELCLKIRCSAQKIRKKLLIFIYRNISRATSSLIYIFLSVM